MQNKDNRTNGQIRIRPATADDARLIAQCVMMGVGYDLAEMTAEKQESLDALVPLARQSGTLYSWRNAVVCECDGEPAGCMVSYPGEGYRRMRAETFPHLPFFRGQDVEAMDVETCAGEYYFDTLAVLPPFRARGIGRALFCHVIAQLRQQHPKLTGTLLVDPANPSALGLYTSLGFCPEGNIFAFGMLYRRMVLKTP